MGTYEDLKAAIADVIYQNGNNEITGLLLQQTLLSMVNNLGEYATFGGIATPDTNPGTADQNVYYLATEAGTYVNFGGIVINAGEAVILSNKTGVWVKNTSGFATQENLNTVINTYNPKSLTGDVKINEVIQELYLTGTLSDKQYGISQVLVYENGGVKRKTVVIREGTNPVAQMDTLLSNTGIAEVFALNNSGISGYMISTIPDGMDYRPAAPYPTLNKDVYLSLSQNPSIALAIEQQTITRIKDNYAHFAVSENEQVNDIIKELYLSGINTNNNYDVSVILVYENGGVKRKTIVFRENGNPVAQMDTLLSNTGIAEVFALNNSGISGYVICDMSEDLQQLNPYATIDKTIISSLDYNPSIKEYIEVNPLKEIINVINVSSKGLYRNEVGSSFNSDFRIMFNYGSESDINGIIKRIKMRAGASGTAYWGVGFIDQNSRVILNRVFSTNVIEGDQTIELTNQDIRINTGEILFALPFYAGGDNSLFRYIATSVDTGTPNRLYFTTSLTGTIFSYQSIGGAQYSYANYSYVIEEIDTPFVGKSDFDDVKNNIQEVEQIANQAFSNSFMIRDRNGELYRMILDNGNINFIPQQFERIVVIGNSITLHGRSDAVNWLTSGYGMAASTPYTDFSAFVLEGCKTKKPNATVLRQNFANWETSLILTDSMKQDINTWISDADLVIFKIGENVAVNTVEEYQTPLEELFNYCLSVNSNAEYVVASLFWSNAIKDAATSAAAINCSFRYCIAAQTKVEEMEEIGHYLKSVDDTYFPITNYGVARHPSDIGMLMIANSILKSLNYPVLNKLFNIVVNSEKDYQCYSQGVAGGIFTIITSGAPTATYGGVNIDIINVADNTYIFEMPEADVTINII